MGHFVWLVVPRLTLPGNGWFYGFYCTQCLSNNLPWSWPINANWPAYGDIACAVRGFMRDGRVWPILLKPFFQEEELIDASKNNTVKAAFLHQNLNLCERPFEYRVIGVWPKRVAANRFQLSWFAVEEGTGKEVLAHYIHAALSRPKCAFCGNQTGPGRFLRYARGDSFWLWKKGVLRGQFSSQAGKFWTANGGQRYYLMK